LCDWLFKTDSFAAGFIDVKTNPTPKHRTAVIDGAWR
jgi:hypothetical protein